ncbi:MAG: DUF1501 domain-containing protein [Labilithrix sp.]|nr:DUF1501 domain-containing protein [Labilithrix sp.]MCW5814355.1 DUF1501 domain-containing protein [Labilithrix sp.]
MNFSRRGFLKALGIGAGAAIGTRIPGARLIGEANAAVTEPTSVVVLHLQGGYNALFASADSLVGRFGVTGNGKDNGNWRALANGNGPGIDLAWFNSMSPFTRQHMAAVGVRHGISNHPGARRALWDHQNRNAGLLLANAIGGTSQLKAAVVGPRLLDSSYTPIGQTSFQSITDMQKTIDALGGGKPDPRVPDRTIAAAGVEAAQTMSGNALTGSPESLDSLESGYVAAIDTLKAPVKKFSFDELKTAYALGDATAVNNLKSKFAAAELMVRAGSNVVQIVDAGWDTHGDTDGATVRNKMRTVLPPLNAFIKRMVEDKTRNVTVVIMGDFARSLPGSDHQPNLTATVIGKNVKVGTTGRTAKGAVTLAPGTPGIAGLWSYLATLAKVDDNPFGANPHSKLVA